LKRISQLLRLLTINRVLVRHGLDELILAMHLFRPVRFVLHLLPWNWFGRNQQPRGERIRHALEDLGPIFVKFGQMLSTRPDLLPPDIAQELAKLQDRVPPFPGHEARAVIEKAYGKPIEEVLCDFDETPLASASIAQVHPAKLADGREVIVKVVRPQIKKVIKRDIALLYTLAELAEKYWSEGKRLRAVEVVSEYEKTILDELDLQREAANASQIRRHFDGSPLLYIPEVHWTYTRPSVMVMERISGIPISNVPALREAGINLEALSERGVEIFFTQVFKHNFFHADMHPGNIFVSPEGQYIAVDFGIVGTLNPEDQRYLAENFLAFFNRDYRRVGELHVESGWVPATTRVDEFEAAIRTVCEPIFEKPLAEISFGQLLLRLFQTARRFNMEVQPQLVLLQKTLLNIEGLGRELNPDLDLWRTAKPFLENWMRDRVGPAAVFRMIKKRAPGWLEKFPDMPDLLHDVMALTRQQQWARQRREDDTELLVRALQVNSRKQFATITGSTLVLAAVLVLLLGPTQAAWQQPLGWMLLGAGLLSWLWQWPRKS